jgi:DNA-binding transcriptional regulator YhcF (GntR family)
MGTDRTNNHAVVQNSGYAYRLKAQILKQELNRTEGCYIGTLQNLLLHYMQALIAQMGQTVVCSRHHALEQQLCRLLLLTLDRLDDNELIMTQEFIANMLGVRRVGITEAAGKLQRAGLIKYHRGHISVVDRAGLEERACECYQVVKKEYERLLPHVTANVIGNEPAYTHHIHREANG